VSEQQRKDRNIFKSLSTWGPSFSLLVAFEIKPVAVAEKSHWLPCWGPMVQAMCWVFFLPRWRGQYCINGIKETLFVGSIQHKMLL
jgi:hypothetical protein